MQTIYIEDCTVGNNLQDRWGEDKQNKQKLKALW